MRVGRKRIAGRSTRKKKIVASRIRTTPISITMNSGVWVGNVPGLGGTAFLAASDPATASIGMMNANRPSNMHSPSIVS